MATQRQTATATTHELLEAGISRMEAEGYAKEGTLYTKSVNGEEKYCQDMIRTVKLPPPLRGPHSSGF